MKSLPRLIAFISAVGLLVLLSGCGGLSEYEQERLDNLNSAVDEFEPDSVSEILCNVSGGEVGLKTGFTRSIVLAGADSWTSVADRLLALGYSGTNDAPYLALSRSDGLFVSGRLIAKPGSEPDLEEELINKGCSIPTDGAVSIQFEEGPPA